MTYGECTRCGVQVTFYSEGALRGFQAENARRETAGRAPFPIICEPCRLCEDDLYLRCQDCGWAYGAMHTPVDETCSQCDGRLDAVHDSGECPRCGQRGGETVCPSCRKRDREPQGETLRLFTPAPNQIPGQLGFA